MTSAVQRELNRFLAKVEGKDYDIQAVTKGAFTQARAHLKPGAFIELNQAAVQVFYEEAPYRSWKGHRLLAVDGSTLNLPTHRSVTQEFGEMGVGCRADVMRSMGRISVCYDVLNLLVVDGSINPFSASENTLLHKHLSTVSFLPHDVLLLDRGYGSVALMYSLQQRGIDFCIRMKSNWWKQVEAFTQSGAASQEVLFELPAKDLYLQTDLKRDQSNVRCRLVAVELENGEKEILCTSLLSEEEYTGKELKELYHLRWNVEEAYKLLKSRVGLETFSGKTATAIRQDFHAKIFMTTYCAAMSFPIEEKVRNEVKNQKRKHPHQINRTNAIAFIKNAWVIIWTKSGWEKILKEFSQILAKTTEIIRPNRKYPRKKRTKYPPGMPYKQL